MNQHEIETALGDHVAHSAVESEPLAGGRTYRLRVHTMDPQGDPAGVDYGPEVLIWPFLENGDLPGKTVHVSADGADYTVVAETVRTVEEVVAAVQACVARYFGRPDGPTGPELRKAIEDAAEAAFDGNALSADWLASILANVQEPDKHDEVAGAILEHEREAAQHGLTDYDSGFLGGLVEKYGRAAVIAAAREVEVIGGD